MQASHSDPACMCSGLLLGVCLWGLVSVVRQDLLGESMCMLHVAGRIHDWVIMCVFAAQVLSWAGLGRGSVLMLAICNLLLTLLCVLILLPEAFLLLLA